MDKTNFMNESKRMCVSFNSCSDHPAKTRQSVFLERYPNARRDCQGILCVCPAEIFGDTVCQPVLCSECRHKFWMQEVE